MLGNHWNTCNGNFEVQVCRVLIRGFVETGFAYQKADYSIVALLKVCVESKDLQKGARLHDYIFKKGLLGKDSVLASNLVAMYVKCGALSKACEVLEGLPVRDVVTWSVLISAYAREGYGEQAYRYFEQMKQEGNSPDSVTFLCILKACTSMRALDKGEKIHAEVVKQGLLRDNVVLGSALVDMYAKCGALAKAKYVLESLLVRNVVTWNALITEYAHDEGYGEEALNCFEKMQQEGHTPDSVTFMSVLKACANIGALDKGRQIHDEIARQGLLEKKVMLGAALVDMYVKCSALTIARKVLEELPNRDVVTWSVLIGGYAQEEAHFEEALDCFEKMQCEGHFPDAVTFVYLLKACGSMKSLDKGKTIHDEINRRGLMQKNAVLGSALVDMYAKCGALTKAHEVLEGLHIRSVVAWNALISGYIQEGNGEEAFECFESMQREGYCADEVSFTCILKACSLVRALEKGKQIHAELTRRGFPGEIIVLGNALVDMYVKCNALPAAQNVLKCLPVRNVVSWNALITGYAREEGYGEEALKCYEWMQQEGHSPDAVTFVCALKACSSIRALAKGKQIHVEISRKGLLRESVMLGSALVDMYAKCGAIITARRVLEGLPVRNGVTWNTLITGCSREEGYGEEALNCYEEMQREGYMPDAVTMMCILNACGSIGALEKGREIHIKVARQGWLEEHYALGNALVDMYAKCGALAAAREVLEDLPVRDVVTWNSIIAGYAQECYGEEALDCFQLMQCEGHSSDVITFTCVLKACGSIGALDKGKQIHAEIVRQKLLGKNVVLGCALVDMYMNCGAFINLKEMLEDLPLWETATWNSMITVLAQHGHIDKAFGCIEQMEHDGFSPDAVTFICLLNVCSHSGLVDQGEMYFVRMNSVYGMRPSSKHQTCMVDLFSRAGCFHKAVEVIKNMPSSDLFLVWPVLLGACQKWGNVRLGRLAFDEEIFSNKQNVAAYIGMSNIYSVAGMDDEAKKIEALCRINTEEVRMIEGTNSG